MMNIFRWLKKLDWTVKIAIVVILVTAYKFDLMNKFCEVFISEKNKAEVENKFVPEPSRNFSCEDFNTGTLHFVESTNSTCEFINEESGTVCLYWDALQALKAVRKDLEAQGYDIKVEYSQTSWMDYSKIYCSPNFKTGLNPNSSPRVKGCEVGVVLIDAQSRKKVKRRWKDLLTASMRSQGFSGGWKGSPSWTRGQSCYSGQVRGVEWRTR
jgi:hypothetical protein